MILQSRSFTAKELAAVSRVCRKLHSIVQTPLLWGISNENLKERFPNLRITILDETVLARRLNLSSLRASFEGVPNLTSCRNGIVKACKDAVGLEIKKNRGFTLLRIPTGLTSTTLRTLGGYLTEEGKRVFPDSRVFQVLPTHSPIQNHLNTPIPPGVFMISNSIVNGSGGNTRSQIPPELGSANHWTSAILLTHMADAPWDLMPFDHPRHSTYTLSADKSPQGEDVFVGSRSHPVGLHVSPAFNRGSIYYGAGFFRDCSPHLASNAS